MNTNDQYDYYLAAKELIQDIQAEKVKNITHCLTLQSLVINSLWKEAFPNMVKHCHATLSQDI